MSFIKPVSALALCSLITGCASYSEDIAATYVSPLQYRDYDCDQIGMEMEAVSRRVGTLSKSLDSKAEGDVWQVAGAVVLWPTLFFLEGGDGPEAAEYARLKGEFETLEKVSIRKKCEMAIAKAESDHSKNKQPSANQDTTDTLTSHERTISNTNILTGAESNELAPAGGN